MTRFKFHKYFWVSTLNEKDGVINVMCPNRAKRATLNLLGVFGLGKIDNSQ